MSLIKQLINFNSSRVRLREVNASFAEIVPNNALILDAGAGKQPYRDLFAHACYESADFEMVDKEYAPPTYSCDLKAIPCEDGRFDFVLLNQVMEHLPDPLAVLQELNRVLKDGGKLFYTAPFFYEEHEQPYDFYRYTQFGIKELFTKAGLRIEKIEWLEGYFGTMAYQLNRMSKHIPLSPSKINLGILGLLFSPFFFVLKVFFFALSLLFHWVETKTKYTGGGYPKNYMAIATKIRKTTV